MRIYFSFFLIAFSFLWANEKEIVQVTRSDAIPKESVEGMPDCYFEGYIQALIDMHFHEYRVVVLVKNKEVYLANLPCNKLLAKSIECFVKDVPGVKCVKVICGKPPKDIDRRENYVHRPSVGGIWFPQTTELFAPIIADPRAVIYSLGYRWGDRVIGKNVVAVSLGDDFPIFRWLNVLPWHGDFQIGIEAGIWSVFKMGVHVPGTSQSSELVNTDFYCGFPLSYAVNKWAFRLRGYHISSHLGDEYLVSHPWCIRVNPSYEAIDLYVSYQANEMFRLYVGPGVIVHSDESFPMKHGYVEYGVECRFLGCRMPYHMLHGTFLVAANFRNWQLNNWDFDGTYIAGYEWSKLQGTGRKIRLFANYHHGFSLEGQFMKERTSYGGIGFAYGF